MIRVPLYYNMVHYDYLCIPGAGIILRIRTILPETVFNRICGALGLYIGRLGRPFGV